MTVVVLRLFANTKWLCQIISSVKYIYIYIWRPDSEKWSCNWSTWERWRESPPCCISHGTMSGLLHKLYPREWGEEFHLLRAKRMRMSPWLWQWLKYSQEDASTWSLCLISCMKVWFICPRKHFRQVARAPTSLVFSHCRSRNSNVGGLDYIFLYLSSKQSLPLRPKGIFVSNEPTLFRVLIWQAEDRLQSWL